MACTRAVACSRSSPLMARDPEEIFAELPQGVRHPELKIDMPEGAHYRFMEKFREAGQVAMARVTLIDGVRAGWPDGWAGALFQHHALSGAAL